MAHPGSRRPLTVDEYLAVEEASDVGHELVAGEVYAHAGALSDLVPGCAMLDAGLAVDVEMPAPRCQKPV